LISSAELISVLHALENREMELLNWGDTGFHFTADELMDVIESTLPLLDPDEVEDALRDNAIIIPVLDSRNLEIGVRSRMAETVHLLRNSRQWFIGQRLEQSRSLVSDYRFIRRARRFPARNLSFPNLLSQWDDNVCDHPSTEDALRTLTGDFNLSGFQARSTSHIIGAWKRHSSWQRTSSATIISAGTGSGKTMAFYLPVLAMLVTDLIRDPKRHVRVLAVYPRKELLKDQVNEALEQVSKLNSLLENSGARKISIGAFFGDTEDSAKYALKKDEEHLAFPYLKCSNKPCRGEMRWVKEDVKRKNERLVCSSCGDAVPGDQFSLTREAMSKDPPDILFTTTEMLNQRMTDANFGHLFGVGVNQGPSMVLLDEVHTYGGSQGAQTAYLLMRWMQLSGIHPHFVGLSATLSDAANFFGALTGTNANSVTSIQSEPEELVEEGAEYLLALRGDPVSQTALLSSTIQAVMLMRRALDQRPTLRSQGIWGSKTFVFVDDLDVCNRLYSGLADAEGWFQNHGGLVPNPRGPLAQLREPGNTNTPPAVLRNFGQDWRFSRLIGYEPGIGDRARLARTSSQDAGYDHDAEVVITTSSLEVGFNDPEVGAVVQHKAPRDVASYLQRKGRAGRPAKMQPWMILVLSDFGRDRLAYQQYENLVDPEIKLQSLPLENDYILKIQAALAVLDWVVRRVPKARLWVWLNDPRRFSSQLEEIRVLLERLMETGPDQDSLSEYIRSALSLSQSVLERVLWQSPRSIILEFIPTLHRRLSSNWGRWSSSEQSVVDWVEATDRWTSPVPEFISSTSFTDLYAPELQITLRRLRRDEIESIAFFQGLREFAPGRVSKRYSTASGEISDWLVPEGFEPVVGDHQVSFDVFEAFGEAVSPVTSLAIEGHGDIQVFQPAKIKPVSMFNDPNVSDSSNAILRWKSHFEESTLDARIDKPVSRTWSETLTGISFFTHGSMSPLNVVRYSMGSDASIKLRNGDLAKVQFGWVKDDDEVAIGAQLSVDGACFEYKVTDEQLNRWVEDAATLSSLRAGFLKDQLQLSALFDGNIFTANWVFECFITAISMEVQINGSDLVVAIENVCSLNSTPPLSDIPRFIFQPDTQQATVGNSDGTDQVLQQDLATLLAREDVRGFLRQSSSCLYGPIFELENALDWARNVLGNTLAASMHQAVCNLLPSIDESSVLADVEFDGARIMVWLTESISGGTGELSRFAEMYSVDPLKVENAMFSSLQAGDNERLDKDLFDFLELLETEDELRNGLMFVRSAQGYQARLTAEMELRRLLTIHGFLLSHQFLAVLHSRILRPGSSAQTDHALLCYLRDWHSLESLCGFELPINTTSGVLAGSEVSLVDPAMVFKRLCEIQSMLWVRGEAVRQAWLKYYNPFRIGNLRTERLLGAWVCRDRTPVIAYAEEDWLTNTNEKLDSFGSVVVEVKRAQVDAIPNVLTSIHLNALDVHGLVLYPRVVSIVIVGTNYRIRIELAEIVSR